jgi:hypothetical protein
MNDDRSSENSSDTNGANSGDEFEVEEEEQVDDMRPSLQ